MLTKQVFCLLIVVLSKIAGQEEADIGEDANEQNHPEGIGQQEDIVSEATAQEEKVPEAITPEEQHPEETIPEETIPEEIIPEETIPEETIPEETIPEETIPEEIIPEETIPEETIPEEIIPEETVPEETIPEEKKPEEIIPEETIPEETIQEEKHPEETIPEEIIPEETIPEETKQEEMHPEKTTTKAVKKKPTKDDQQLKRYVIEENFKPAIFGSYYFDPIKQEFSVHQKKNIIEIPLPTIPHDCEAEFEKFKQKNKIEVEHQPAEVTKVDDDPVNDKNNTLMRKMITYKIEGKNGTVTTKIFNEEENIIKKFWKKVLSSTIGDAAKKDLLGSGANIWVPGYESDPKYASHHSKNKANQFNKL